MATARAYDEYHDVGMTFTETEVQSWNPKAFAQQRIDVLCGRARLAERRHVQPKTDKPEFWKDCARMLLKPASWYAHALVVPGLDKEAILTLPDPRSKEGKALAAEALKLDPEEWIPALRADAEHTMRFVVTIGRERVSTTWHKVEGIETMKQFKSFSNKLANAVHSELAQTAKLLAMYASLSS